MKIVQIHDSTSVTLLVNLSDIHIHFRDSNPILDRIPELVAAIRGVEADQTRNCIFLFSGDVAFSGNEVEYEKAKEFVLRLNNALLESHIEVIGKVFVPGNHDCKFPSDTVARDSLRSKALENPAPSVINGCLEVQRPYFEFRQAMTDLPIPNGGSGLYDTHTFKIGDNCIRINAFNTSWLSEMHEKPGTLNVPTTAFEVVEDENDSLVISMFHHPMHWLEPQNRRVFIGLLERTSDIAIYGHEHESYLRETLSRDGASQLYIEAGVLQETHDRTKSSFQVIALDLGRKFQRVISFVWDKDFYRTETEQGWRDSSQNSLRKVREFQFSPVHQQFLLDNAFPFATTKGNFTLEDLFVLPSLSEYSSRELYKKIDPKLGKPIEKQILSSRVLEVVKQEKTLLIYGSEKSGKTAFLKRLHAGLQTGNHVPVYIDLERFKTQKPDDVSAAVESIFRSQYQTPTVDRFRQLERERRVILVDNFHTTKLNSLMKDAIIERLSNFAEMVIIASADDASIHDLEIQKFQRSLQPFKRFVIMPFGFSLREKLIQKWFLKSDPYVTLAPDIENRCAQAATYVNQIISSKLIASTPLNVLMVLQQLEAHLGSNFNTATYSAFCELYVKQSLGEAAKTSNLNQGMLERILELFAYLIFETKETGIPMAKFDNLVTDYRTHYKMEVETQRILNELLVRGLVRQSMDGIEFCHNYQYRYFVASGLARLLQTNQLEANAMIQALVDDLHLENAANIIVLLGHITKDLSIVQRVFDRAKTTFIGLPSCDFDETTEFANRLTDRVPDVTVDVFNILENRQRNALVRDGEDESNGLSSDALVKPSTEEYESSVDEMDDAMRGIFQINGAFKTIDVLGQMLRSYAGTLDGSFKIQITRECYDLSMRTLGTIYTLFDQYLEDTVLAVAEILNERFNIHNQQLSKDETEKRAMLFIFNLLTAAGDAMLRRVTQAVGTQELKPVFNDLIENAPLSYLLIDYSVHIGTYFRIDFLKLQTLIGATKGRLLAQSILKRVTMMHLYLFNNDYRDVQRVSEVFELNTSKANVVSLSGRDQKRNILKN
jgi:hypothetical protein